jgi:putative transposase
MPEYRRNRVPGGCYFFTVNLAARGSDLLTIRIEALRGAVQLVRAQRSFHIDAWVVMPDHLHCIWTLPPGDSDYSCRWQSIKARFSRAIPKEAPAGRKGDRGVWQQRYWEHTIRDDQDYAAHMNYTHFNPVKHGFTNHPGEWPFSSFKHCVASGFYPADWAGIDEPLEAGERLPPAS